MAKRSNRRRRQVEFRDRGRLDRGGVMDGDRGCRRLDERWLRGAADR